MRHCLPRARSPRDSREVALLYNRARKLQIALGSRCLVGRSAGATLRINDRRISGEHARLSWDGRRWDVRDLGSRNGTFLDGVRLDPGSSVALQSGACLAFGRRDEIWELSDASPPTLVALAEGSGLIRSARDGLLALPDDADPSVTLFERVSGAWAAELEGGLQDLHDQQLVAAGGQTWRLMLPAAHEPTLAEASLRARLEALALRINVSRDEEHVEITVLHQDGEFRLPNHAQQYLLVILGRRRLEDRRRDDLPPSEHGWVYTEDLLDMLRIDLQHLNVHVFRLRKQLAEAGVAGAANLIERRRSTRQIRIAVADLEILPS